MKMSKLFFIAISLMGCINLNAQDKSNDTTAKYFIIQASIGNLQEIAIAKLAVEKAVNPEIKDFAKRMITDHTNAQNQLMQLIKSRGFQIPNEATDTPVEDMMLKNKSGNDFDREYVHMMVPDHGLTVKTFEKYTIMGKDPSVIAFAQQTLPVLKEHLAAITAIDNKMKDAVAK